MWAVGYNIVDNKDVAALLHPTQKGCPMTRVCASATVWGTTLICRILIPTISTLLLKAERSFGAYRSSIQNVARERALRRLNDRDDLGC